WRRGTRPGLRPTNGPNPAPGAAPAPAPRRHDRRPVTRSTSIRSTPTMGTSCTGNSLSARKSTARWACPYSSYEPIGQPDGLVGSRGGPAGLSCDENELVTDITPFAVGGLPLSSRPTNHANRACRVTARSAPGLVL